ncbi:MAG: DNA polymerase III subunit alpha [Deltaproteobacteria bacterium]|nr:DNA polymerase III subunit alpha [Deltaproteobacteria bacterium]
MAENISPFVHLHVHTQYSLLDGAITIDALLNRAKKFGMESVAITDHGTMFGVVEFYEKAINKGINPVIGCECYVAPRSLTDKTVQDSKELSHLVLLAKNNEGYKNLCKLASIAQLKGFYYKPRIDKELLQKHIGGLIGLSACLHGEIPRLIKNNQIEKADEAAIFFHKIFGEDNFYLEVQENGIELQDRVNRTLLEMSRRLSIPLVATNDCHYLNREDSRAHEILLCIQTGHTINDNDRFRFSTDQLYFKSQQEMIASFNDFPGAIEHTSEIANRCNNIEFDFKTYHFPKFVTSSEQTVDEIFDQKVKDGYKQRWKMISQKNPDLDKTLYEQRLEYEISLINDMGFPGYFLIVADFINYAKNNNIPIGPGRGSAAGSLVAYSMGITDLDPLEYGLIFERFLNPARKSMPDIDVDICINGREKVFQYVVEKYGGGDYVAQIITFGKLKTRAVIRDVGRALDIPLREVDSIAKMVPDVLNISLNDALEQEPKITALAESKSEINDLIEICRVLEGLTRHASTHAAGVVIADKPLVEYLPLYKGKKGEVVTQFSMKYVEKIGLVKFDFLGLRNLTVIADTISLIEQQKKTAPDVLNLDLEDQDTYRLLSSGETKGVFQLESSGMRDLLVRLRPECFEDIIALVALYRPGPLESGMVDDFVERKHGRKSVEYLLPQLEPILKETYGVIVYQEQVMKIAGVLADYSMSEADDLRKAMGKKIPEILAKHRDRFLKGAEKNGIDPGKAGMLFDLIEKFGGYGFNKSHSAAYALISFQTAFLKAHYPVELMAALLTSEMHTIDHVVKYINECRSRNIDVLPPDINESGRDFTIKDGKIRFGLVAVKNVGEGAIGSICKIREQGSFKSIFDLCERVALKKVNKRVLESLIKCGAFDSMGYLRSRLMASIEDALDYGQRVQKEKADRQMSLFDMGGKSGQAVNMPQIPKIEEWDEKQILLFEKESLGFYITGHPLSKYQELIDKFTDADTVSLKKKQDGSAVRIGGIVSKIKTINTKKGELMAFVVVEDMHSSVEIVVFSSIYVKACDLLIVDSPILVQGQLQKDEKNLKILADMIVPMEKAEETWTASIHFNLQLAGTEKDSLVKLRNIFKKYPGTCNGFIHLVDDGKTDTIFSISDQLKLKACKALTREVNLLTGYDSVKTVCSPARLVPKKNGYRGNNQKRRYHNA